jgi:ABC-type transport system substrate-binding protein
VKIYDKIQKVRVLRKNLSIANLNKRPKKIIILSTIFVVILLFTNPLMNLSIDMNKPIDDELIPFNDNPNLNGVRVSEFVFGVAYGPFDLEPQFAWDSSSIDVIDQVCEGLYKYNLSDPDHAIIPNLATAFGTWSSDKKNYTIPLREGVLFHDYTPFDANSVEWSFNRTSNPNCRIIYMARWYSNH